MTRRTSKKQHSAPKTLPDYQMFPVGMWPMFGAVLLMLACLMMTVLLISDIAALWVKEQTLMYLELAAWVLLSLILSTSTFLLSRGYCIFHRFLIWHNRAYMLLLAAATLFAWLAGTTSMVLVGAMGLGCALLAHWLYCSKKYSKGVEHYRLIWAHFRAQKP